MNPVPRELFGARLVVAGLALALVLAGCGADPDIPTVTHAPSPTPTPHNPAVLTIGASFAVLDPFLSSVADAVQARAKAIGNVDVQVVNAEGSTATQLQQVQAFVDQRVDAIIVVPDDTDATAPITDLVRGAGIPLVYLNRRPSSLPGDGSVPYIGSDSLAAGTIQMRALAEAANGHGTVALLIGDPANEAAVVRTEGAKDVIVQYPNLRLLRESAAGWDRAEAHDAVQAWLNAGDTFDVVSANDDEMALGAIDALREAGLLDRTIVGGVDGTADALAAVQAGDLDVTVFEDAATQGADAVDAAVSLADGEKVTSRQGVIDVPQRLVTKANVGDFLAHG
jgi:inositol transport system substrate-binding protein